MKVCTGCKENLPLENFGVNKSKSDGRQTQCKSCRNKYAKKWYSENSSEHYQRTRDSHKKLRQEVYEYLLEHPCVDCGEARPECLEFDHIDRETKIASIAQLLSKNARHKLFVEIEKCVVRCANCHRMVTAKQFGWYSGFTRAG